MNPFAIFSLEKVNPLVKLLYLEKLNPIEELGPIVMLLSYTSDFVRGDAVDS